MGNPARVPTWFCPLIALPVVVLGLVLGRDMLRSHHVRSALRADQMDRALRCPRPSWLARDHATYCHAVAALLTGDLPRAEELLDELPAEPSARSLIDAADVKYLRAELFVESGRHADAARLLGDAPADGRLRRVRAAAALERGDDGLAQALLQPAGESGYEEAMRLRGAGALAGRRGRWAESSSYLHEALAILAGVEARDYPGLVVDEAWVHHYLAEGAFLAGDLRAAVAEAGQATALMDRHGGHPQGMTMSHCLAAQASARSGDLDAARHHLHRAWESARRLHGEPFRAELMTAEAEVAWAEGHGHEARAFLTTARAIRDSLGEVPARDRADALLAEWAAT